MELEQLEIQEAEKLENLFESSALSLTNLNTIILKILLRKMITI
jgi:hypothetical protein